MHSYGLEAQYTIILIAPPTNNTTAHFFIRAYCSPTRISCLTARPASPVDTFLPPPHHLFGTADECQRPKVKTLFSTLTVWA